MGRSRVSLATFLFTPLRQFGVGSVHASSPYHHPPMRIDNIATGRSRRLFPPRARSIKAGRLKMGWQLQRTQHEICCSNTTGMFALFIRYGIGELSALIAAAG
ncbi:hypothetical protein PSPO01_03741 [Paraphaeosphaeria sporulosa]